MQSNIHFSKPVNRFFICGLLSLLSACGGGGWSKAQEECIKNSPASPKIISNCVNATPSRTTTPLATITPTTTPSAPAPAQIPKQGFINISPNIKLEYVDFGGTGEAILLLAGAGNSAHVFEDFAQGLSAKYRVYALTRRGYGASSQPTTGYDNATLTEDIRSALNQLGIQRVHLIGHSIASEEMTRFAGLYPERVNRLVYLDAAYDRVTPPDDIILKSGFIDPVAPAITPADLVSIDSVNNFNYRVIGTKLPKTELKAILHFASNGAIIGEVTPSEITEQHHAGVEVPNYSRVKARALAIFPDYTSAAQTYPWLTPASPEWVPSNTFVTNFQVPYHAKQHAKFKAELIGSSVLLIPNATHYLFLTHPEPVTAAILQFLTAP